MKPLDLRTPTSLGEGLTTSQIQSAKKNQIETNPQTSLGRIWFDQFFSFFNIVNYILAALIIFTGSWRNLLFMGVVIANTCIGLFQKLRSRKILNNLALIHQQTYSALRNGKWTTLPLDEIVEGDVLRLQAGSQIPCDGVIRQGECQVNESLLTGESEPHIRTDGQTLYGGCFIIAGTVLMQAAKVGNEQYMASILETAKKDKEYPSELRDSIDWLIKLSSFLIVPVGLLLFAKQYFYSGISLDAALLNTCASLIGMIPEGLVVLTSTALAAASVTLARKNVLIHDLYCVETLARVDTLCLDKTGTLTTGAMKVKQLIPQNKVSEAQMKQDLADLFGSIEDDNLTAAALRTYLKDVPPKRKATKNFPFSSASKCSGAVFDHELLVLGAYSFVFSQPDPAVLEQIETIAKRGDRVLVLASEPASDTLGASDQATLLGLVVIEDELRPNVNQIVDYFKKQDVTLKVISGDQAATVEAIAHKAGIDGQAVNMNEVSDEQIPDLMKTYSIFGRVTPQQKMLMVTALQNQGHIVAMTGDGVNDVMALKKADCSIAMGTGAQAAAAVSSLVLLDDQFGVLPNVVDEGRRVINNIKRTASLFLVKTLFSLILSLLTLVWMSSYPFIPIQLTLVSSLGTGIPAFLLTFEKDHSRLKGHFLSDVLSRALPGALAVSFGISLAYIAYALPSIPLKQSSYQSMCTALAALNAIVVLYRICVPFTPLRKLVWWGCSLGMLACFIFFPSVFLIEHVTNSMLLILLALGVLQEIAFHYLWKLDWSTWVGKLLDRMDQKKKKMKTA